MRLPALIVCLVALPGSVLADGAAEWSRGPYFTPTVHQIGAGATPEMAGDKADFLKGLPEKKYRFYPASMERKFSAEAWRGKRVRVALRLKNEDGARSRLGLEVEKPNHIALHANDQFNRGGAWQNHQFVVEVPEDATTLALRVSMQGGGTAWVDSVKLEAVGADVPLTQFRRYDYGQNSLFNGGHQDSFGN